MGDVCNGWFILDLNAWGVRVDMGSLFKTPYYATNMVNIILCVASSAHIM